MLLIKKNIFDASSETQSCERTSSVHTTSETTSSVHTISAEQMQH